MKMLSKFAIQITNSDLAAVNHAATQQLQYAKKVG